MTWYRDPGITCNCTRPPVEQPDHRRRLILAPKPSSALYNTRLYTATCYAPLYTTTSTRIHHCHASIRVVRPGAAPHFESCVHNTGHRAQHNTQQSTQHNTQHRTRYCTLLHFCWESWWHRVPELRLDSPSSGTVTTPCSWWSSHTTRRQILASRKKNRRWQCLLFKTRPK